MPGGGEAALLVAMARMQKAHPDVAKAGRARGTQAAGGVSPAGRPLVTAPPTDPD